MWWMTRPINERVSTTLSGRDLKRRGRIEGMRFASQSKFVSNPEREFREKILHAREKKSMGKRNTSPKTKLIKVKKGLRRKEDARFLAWDRDPPSGDNDLATLSEHEWLPGPGLREWPENGFEMNLPIERWIIIYQGRPRSSLRAGLPLDEKDKLCVEGLCLVGKWVLWPDLRLWSRLKVAVERNAD